VTRLDIRSIFVGQRPLVKPAHAKNTKKISRKHEVFMIQKGFITEEKLFSLFDEYAEKNNIKPAFNGTEKTILLLECSTLRYKTLEKGKLSEELNWAERNVLVQAFQKRMAKLKTQGVAFKSTPDQLAAKAIDHLKGKISVEDAIDPSVDDRTMAAIAIGKGGNGFHHLLNAKMEGAPADYGFVIGKDYSEALADKDHEDHELALVLKEQMAPLPDVDPELTKTAETKEFMNTPLARTIRSIPALAMVIGPDKYRALHDYSKNGRVINETNKEGLKEFIKIVKEVREAQERGFYAINVKGFDGQEHTFVLRLSIKSGVFNKCGNYSMLVREDVGIVPKAEALKVFATGTDEHTNVDTAAVKKFYGLTGGVSATVDISPSGKIILPPNPTNPNAGPGPRTDVDTLPSPTAEVPTGSGSSALTQKN
jgi:hypothetical protein